MKEFRSKTAKDRGLLVGTRKEIDEMVEKSKEIKVEKVKDYKGEGDPSDPFFAIIQGEAMYLMMLPVVNMREFAMALLAQCQASEKEDADERGSEGMVNRTV